MRESVVWLSLLATSAFSMGTSSRSSEINTIVPTLPAVTKAADAWEALTVTITVGVTIWLGDGETCTPEPAGTMTDTITDTVTETKTVTDSGSVTITQTISVPATTVTDVSTVTTSVGQPTVTETSIVPTTVGDSTVTVPESTVTLPETTITGSTAVTTRTVSGSSSVITTIVTEPATTVTVSDSTGTISTITTTITRPGNTVTVVGSTTIVDTVTAPGSTITDTVTVPVTKTVPTTDTATISGSDTTLTQSSDSTTTVSVSVCSSLISNPSYTPTAALPENYTWGCPPGQLCRPPHTGDRYGCNVEAGLPAVGYVCSPSECIPAPPLNINHSRPYNVSENYYNLDPKDFGLNYSIFQSSGDSSSSSSKRDMSLWDLVSGRKTKRVDITDIPASCYNDCNDAALEPQLIGKSRELCDSDSPFMEDLSNCEACVTNNAQSGPDTYSSTLLPSFAQFLNFCSDMTTSTSTTTGTTATNTQATSTQTTITQATSTGTKNAQSTTASVSASIVTTSVSGSLVTTSVSGSFMATSVPGSAVTMSSTLGVGATDGNTSTKTPGNVASIPAGIPSSSSRRSPTGSGTPLASSTPFNAATSTHVPRVCLLGLLWAVVASLL